MIKTNLPHIILVLGMHRSGTSLIAKLISEWGAYLGNNLLPANSYNHVGYWEHQPLVHFHEKLLKKTNNRWYAPSELIDTASLLEEFGEEARHLVDEMDRANKIWCWKDPRLPLFLDFWQKILAGREVTYIISHRSPNAIAASLSFRDEMPASLALALWEFTSGQIFRSIAQGSNNTIIPYDKLVVEPETYCKKLFDFLNLTSGRVQSTKQYENMVTSVKRSLNHAKPIHLPLSPLQKAILEIYEEKKNPLNLTSVENALLKKIEKFSFYRNPIKDLQHIKYAQLFYPNQNNEYVEALSVMKDIDKNTRELTFRFVQPVSVKTLRFDPVNTYVRLRIDEIHFFYNNSLLDVKYTLSSNDNRYENDVLMFGTEDPQVHIHLESMGQTMIGEVTIKLEYLEIGLDAITRFIDQKTVDIEHILENTNRFDHFSLETKCKIDALKSDIIDQKEMFKHLSDQIDETLQKLEISNRMIESKVTIIEKQKELITQLQNSWELKADELSRQMEWLTVKYTELIESKRKKSLGSKVRNYFNIPIKLK